LVLTLPVTDDKTPQNCHIPPFGYPWFQHMVLMDEDHRYFPKKTGTIFPGKEPPLFFCRNAPPDLPEVPDNLADQPAFHAQRNAAKLHGFFPIKTLGFKKHLI
jgi:hypothetical protein